MAKVKYSVREYTPTGNMPGVHGFYAKAQQDNTITNAERKRTAMPLCRWIWMET